MLADKYAEAVRGIAPAVEVKLIDGVNHMGIVSDPKAVSADRRRRRHAPTERGKRVMTSIDSKQASEALSEINDIVRRVRQSRIYDLASQIMILWGVLVFAGNLATWLWPRYGGYIWIAVNVAGVVGLRCDQHFRLSADRRAQPSMCGCWRRSCCSSPSDIFCSAVLGHFTPRQMGTFWPIYFMLFYMLAGLWFGHAFVAIGLGITALTLIGYFFVGGCAFLLWMAVVNGGGLILGGLWMRRS